MGEGQTAGDVYDVIVAGSGAAGLTCALVAAQSGLKTLVIEKAAQFGGTTALSGGGAWIPCNHLMTAIGQQDDAAAAHQYLRFILGNKYDPVWADALIASGPEMLRYLEEHSDVRFFPIPLSDYTPDGPGARLARTLIASSYDGRKLGGLIRKVRNPLPGFVAFGSFQVEPLNAGKLTNPFGSLENFRYTTRRMVDFATDLFRFGKGTFMANGNALVGSLLRSAVDAGVELCLETAAVEAVLENGRIAGLRTATVSGSRTLLARRGVVLACGGFGANVELRRRFMPQPDVHLSAQPKENVGDGIRLGQSAGGQLAEANEANGIWAPCSAHRDRDGHILSVYPHFGPDRGKPGSLIVGTDGRRFADEAEPYQTFVNTMNRQGITAAWFIAHKPALRRYGMGVALPAPMPYRHLVRDGYLVEAASVQDLAARIAVPADALDATIRRFNEMAMRGVDEDFGRGGNIYDNAQGDYTHKPNPNLAPLTQAPFYAVKLQPGDCSSVLGLTTSIDSEVLDHSGAPVPGLYALGLDQNSMMRGEYPGGGSSIGPAMTFAYRAAQALVRQRQRQESGRQ